jgi:hypothetical protein
MKTPKPFSEQKGSANEKAESGKDSLTDPAMIDFASVLDDFLDEEVVDQEGTTIGTLACYWQSVSGMVVFLGIKVTGDESIRVVPGRPSQVDDRHACIRLRFDAEDIESAPRLDCATELDATRERTVYEHFRIQQPQPHGGLQYFAANREADARTNKNKRKDRTT